MDRLSKHSNESFESRAQGSALVYRRLKRYQTSNWRSTSVVCPSPSFFVIIVPFDAVFSQIPRLFALIIGINKYQMNHRTLRGAVPDGKAFKTYLMNRVCVPESHIISLFDRYATRTKIIEGFRKLRDNKDIEEGDPIFIFYAGHGSQKRAHPDWALEDRNVQMREVILPHDCEAVNEEYPEGVEPIPDHTIGILIDEIAAKKGNNIVSTFWDLLAYSLTPSYRLSCLTVAIQRRGRVVRMTTH